MSVAVQVAQLSNAIEGQIGWCYLLTVSDDGQPRILAVTPQDLGDGMLRFEVGKGTGENVSARPSATLLFPPSSPEAMSLIVDGTATIEAGSVSFVATSAVMHRSAVRS
jgi:hypothetical protein